MPEAKPQPSSPLPARPLATSTNLPTETRYSVVSLVASSYKRRRRTDALAALEGRSRSDPDTRNFMDLTGDDDDETEPHELEDDAAEFYGRVISFSPVESPSTSASALPSSHHALAEIASSRLDLSEGSVLPPSPKGQFARQPSTTQAVPRMDMPVPKTKKIKEDTRSFLPMSPSSGSSTSTAPWFAMESSASSPPRRSPFPSPLKSASTAAPAWAAWGVEVPFLPPFTFEDLDFDFSLPPRPAPSPKDYSPPIRPSRRSEDDLPIQSEFALEQAVRLSRSTGSSDPLNRSGSRSRTFSTPPTRSASRRTKKGRQGLSPLKSFIEFDLDLRSSLSSKPSQQSLHTSYWNWNKDSALLTS